MSFYYRHYQVGELVLKRLINEFRKAFRRNQKDRCLSTARFLAHLVNQKVVHELIILELLTLLLEQTTDDSVEVAVSVLKECGAMLSRLVPKGVHGIFEHLRRILNEGQCDKRISYMLEVMFQVRFLTLLLIVIKTFIVSVREIIIGFISN